MLRNILFRSSRAHTHTHTSIHSIQYNFQSHQMRPTCEPHRNLFTRFKHTFCVCVTMTTAACILSFGCVCLWIIFFRVTVCIYLLASIEIKEIQLRTYPTAIKAKRTTTAKKKNNKWKIEKNLLFAPRWRRRQWRPDENLMFSSTIRDNLSQ